MRVDPADMFIQWRSLTIRIFFMRVVSLDVPIQLYGSFELSCCCFLCIVYIMGGSLVLTVELTIPDIKGGTLATPIHILNYTPLIVYSIFFE